MTAIYKREVKSYLTSVTGYLFIFFVLLMIGIYFSAYQLGALYPKFEYTLNASTFIFLIGAPLLTMGVLAQERKQKTDQMLLTAPVSVEGIVIGKYLALETIFLIPVLIISFYPLIIGQYGTVSYKTAYTAILGYFLLGSANLAIGFFISSITESQVIAAVLTIIVLFAFYMMEGISSFFSEGSLSTCITFGILIFLVMLLLMAMIHNLTITLITGIVLEGILIVVYVMKSSLFEGGIQNVLQIFNISGHFENFSNGILDLGSSFYFLSIIAICMFLTIQSIVKRRWN